MSPPENNQAAPDAGDLLGGLSPPPESPPVPAPALSRVAKLAREGAAAEREIAALLGRARSRARGLAAAQLASLGVATAVLALSTGALVGSVASAWVARLCVGLVFAAGAVALVLFARRAPVQQAARSSRDPRALARLLGSSAGGAGDLLSSVELSRSPPEGASRELLALLHQRAAAGTRGIDLRRALPRRELYRPLAALGLVVAVLAAFALLAQQRFSLGLLRLYGGESAAPRAQLSPIAGDLSITYLYPQYMQLPPRVEQGTAGDLRAPRGTEVQLAARADRDLDKAWAVLEGAGRSVKGAGTSATVVALNAEGPGHRALSGSLTLKTPGSWHLRYTDAKGRTVAEGPNRPVEITPDLPPQAAVDEPRKLELEVDPEGKLAVIWSASDDYGLTKVSLVFQQPGEKEARVLLSPPVDAGAQVKRLRGTYAWELSPLHLRAGDKVSYFIEAQDNDAVDGSQRGVSQTHVLKVFSAAEHHREALLRAQQLWERLVFLLADRLEEKPPPPNSDAAQAPAWYDPTAQKDRDALSLVAEMGKTGRELLSDKLAPKPVGRALRYVQASLGVLVQRTSIARAPLSRGTAGREGSVRMFGLALSGEVKEEEKDVLYLEDLLDRARLADMQELGREMAQSRQELARLAEKLRKAPDEATKQALLAEVARLRTRVQDLMQRMAEMAKGIRDEHLNEEAVQAVQKEQDLMSQLSEVQRKLQSGDVDAALKELDKLSAQLEQVEKGLQDKATAQGDQKYAEEGRQLREAAGELSKLKEREQALQERTSKLRRAAQAGAEKRFAQKGGKELAKKLLEKVALAKKAVAEIDPRVSQGLGLEESQDAAQGRVEDLKRALEAGDYDEALDEAQRGLRAVDQLQQRLSIEDQFAQQSPGFSRDPQAVRKALHGAVSAQQPLGEVASALREALPSEGKELSPQEQQELRSEAGEQNSIKEGFKGVRQKLSAVGKKVPIFGPAHEQMLQEAQDGMQQAGEKLGQGQPRGAQAGEGQALDKLSQFEKAMQEMAKNGSGSPGAGMPMPWGEPQGEEEGEEEGNDGSTSREHVEIPDAESSRGPQEFRKELLDAMKQKAPDRFKEKVKQYYEELVK